jgi:hypothetical protein
METSPFESPSAESSQPDNPCCERTHKHSFALAVTSDDGHEYFFGTAQFLDAELTANASVEQSENAPPERLQIRYATGEIVLLGRGLHKLAQWLQRGELESLKPLGKRYAGLRLRDAFVTSITVSREDNP